MTPAALVDKSLRHAQHDLLHCSQMDRMRPADTAITPSLFESVLMSGSGINDMGKRNPCVMRRYRQILSRQSFAWRAEDAAGGIPCVIRCHGSSSCSFFSASAMSSGSLIPSIRACL